MQVQTERGLIYLTTDCVMNPDDARSEGYSYTFTSHVLGYDLYSKNTDDKGYCRTFVKVARD